MYRSIENEMWAPCMFDWQGTLTFFSRSGMLNPKFGLSCVHYVIQISQLLLSCVHCVIQISQLLLTCVHCVIQMIIQITHFALVWKQQSLCTKGNKYTNHVFGVIGDWTQTQMLPYCASQLAVLLLQYSQTEICYFISSESQGVKSINILKG